MHSLWGGEPKTLHKYLHDLGPKQAAAFITQHSGLLNQLNEVNNLLGSEYQPVISKHYDEIRERTQNYSAHQKPEDYLDSFNHFIKQQLNQSHNWLPAQRKWLERLAKQLIHEVIIDRDFVNNRFGEQGGAQQLDKVLGNQLDTVLDELSDAIWPVIAPNI